MDVVVGVLQGKPHPFPESCTKQPPERKPPKCGIKALVDFWKRFLLRVLASVLVFTVTFGPPCFYLSAHLLLEPGLATFIALFQPSVCVVVSSSVLEGTSNCSWSSCRQGCTDQDLYRCWQVLILSLDSPQHHRLFNRSIPGNMVEDLDNITDSITSADLNLTLIMPSDVEKSETEQSGMLVHTSNDQKSLFDNSEISQRDLVEGLRNASWSEVAELIKLKVSVKGCGYDSCEVWWRNYSTVGTAFSCHVSADRSVALPHLDHNFAAAQVALGILPLILTLNAVIIMYGLYCRKGSGSSILKLSLNPEKMKQKKKLAQTQLILQRAMAQKRSPESKFDSLLLMTVAANSKVAPGNHLPGSRQVWKGDVSKGSNRSGTQADKLNVHRRWQELAKLATHRVHVSTVTAAYDDTLTKLQTKS